MAAQAHLASNVTRQGAATAAAEEEDVDVDTVAEPQAAGAYGQAGLTPAPVAPPPVEAPPPKTARSRPTNNQLLYKAYFRWSHYQFKLQPGLVLPEETEACASVTSAFLQVLNTLFFVETRRIENPRNILQLLSMNTRRTKVVELSSGTHRVPDELKRHSLSDGGSGSYSTNLDRNRYGNDDQYLSTVIRYDLEFLDLCPCMVDVEIIDAKNGQGSILVSADPEMCNCGTAGAGGLGAGLAPAGLQAARQVQHASPQLPQPLPRGAASPAAPAAARSAQKAASAGGGDGPLHAAPVPAGPHPTASKNSGSELFDALLIAATGGGDDAGGATSKQAAAVPPGIPRARSRLWHTGASGEGESLQNAVEAFKAGDNEEIASGLASWEGGRGSPAPLPAPGSKGKRISRRSSLSNMAGLSSPVADDGVASLPPLAPLSAGRAGGLPSGQPTGGEESGENGPRQEAEQPSVAGDGALLGGGGGGGAPGGVVHAGSAANLARLGRDQDLRRLQDDFRGLKEDARALEGQLTTMRAREAAAASAVAQAREDADAQRQAVSALRAEVARLTAAKEAAEKEAAAVKTQVQAHGGSVATPPPEGPTSPVSPQAGGHSAAPAAEQPSTPPAANGPADLAPGKRKLEGGAADEPGSKRPAAVAAVHSAPAPPTAPEPTPAAG